MAREKFVVRLLDEADDLVAWATVYAEPRPQARGASCPYMPCVNPTRFVAERTARVVGLSVHWCDLDVARRATLVEPLDVTEGAALHFAWMEPVWLVPGAHDVPLPPVTERASIALSPPTGNLAATS